MCASYVVGCLKYANDGDFLSDAKESTSKRQNWEIPGSDSKTRSYEIKLSSFGCSQDTSGQKMITAWKTLRVEHQCFLRETLHCYPSCLFALLLGIVGLIGIRLFRCWMQSPTKN